MTDCYRVIEPVIRRALSGRGLAHKLVTGSRPRHAAVPHGGAAHAHHAPVHPAQPPAPPGSPPQPALAQNCIRSAGELPPGPGAKPAAAKALAASPAPLLGDGGNLGFIMSDTPPGALAGAPFPTDGAAAAAAAPAGGVSASSAGYASLGAVKGAAIAGVIAASLGGAASIYAAANAPAAPVSSPAPSSPAPSLQAPGIIGAAGHGLPHAPAQRLSEAGPVASPAPSLAQTPAFLDTVSTDIDIPPGSSAATPSLPGATPPPDMQAASGDSFALPEPPSLLVLAYPFILTVLLRRRSTSARPD